MLYSYPGRGEGKSDPVPIACARAKISLIFRKILREINGVCVVVHGKRVRKEYPVFKRAPGAEPWISTCATRRRRISIVAGYLGMEKKKQKKKNKKKPCFDFKDPGLEY